MQTRKISGKSVSHPRRQIRRLRAEARTAGTIDAYVRGLLDRADALEASLRAPQGGRRHRGRA